MDVHKYRDTSPATRRMMRQNDHVTMGRLGGRLYVFFEAIFEKLSTSIELFARTRAGSTDT